VITHYLFVCSQAVIGNRYGYRPVPSLIEEGEFDKLKSAAPSSDQWSLVSIRLSPFNFSFMQNVFTVLPAPELAAISLSIKTFGLEDLYYGTVY
jgi:hypothetical protein